MPLGVSRVCEGKIASCKYNIFSFFHGTNNGGTSIILIEHVEMFHYRLSADVRISFSLGVIFASFAIHRVEGHKMGFL